MQDLDKIVKKLRNLKQNKDLSDEVILKMAEEELNKKEIISSLTFCVDDAERDYAKQMLDKYLAQSTIENEADKDTLKQLVDLQILTERIKTLLKTEYNKANPAIPLQMVEQLRETEKQIMEIKEQLGLTSLEKGDNSLSEALSMLKKKALKYYEDHAGCNIVKCPYCQNIFYLLLRTEYLTPEKCKWFKGTTLYNYPLMELVEKKVITEEKAADILGVNVLYVQKIYNEIYLREKNEESNNK